MFPRRDSQPGEHDDLEHDAEHLPDDGRQQRNSLGGERQRQREPEKPDRIVRKGVPALPEVLDGFDGIAAGEDVVNGAGAGSCAVVGHHRGRPLGDGVDYKWPRAWASAAMRTASALRSDSFFFTQTSQDFPDAVSSPVKAIATMSAQALFRSPARPSANRCRNGAEATACRVKMYSSPVGPAVSPSLTSPGPSKARPSPARTPASL